MPQKKMLNKVCRAIEILINAADKYEGLFPSILDRTTFEIPGSLPKNIKGQRNEDRAYPGNNLLHDEVLLRTMYDLSKPLGRKDYSQAADKHLKRFATHCTNTVTGLFPWGEHSFWNLAKDEIGNSFPLAYPWWTDLPFHDHLRPAPFWMWEKLYEYNPKCVERFSEGLDYHWRDGEPQEYCRHANIQIKIRPAREPRSCDFPRHGGFYIMDWSFAYTKTGRKDFLAQIHRMLDHWWEKRDENGMLLGESKSPKELTGWYGTNSPGQTMSLAMSLLETADFLKGTHPELSAIMQERGTVYANSFLSLPHDLEKGIYVSSARRDTNEALSTMSIWGSSYGSGTACSPAVLCLGLYRMTNSEGLFKWAEAVGRRYLSETVPDDMVIPAVDLGMAVGLMADLYDITGEKVWLYAGLKFARKLMEIYFDGDLPRGEASIDFYDAQMGTGFLLYGLARIAMLSESRENCPIGPDYTGR